MKKEFKKKGFYKIRPIRMSDDAWDWLNSIKKGTWNYTIIGLKKRHGENKSKKL